MNFLESIQMAGKTLVSNKLRSALTMLGIVIGNASVITMMGIGEGGQRFVNQELESLGPNVLFVIPGNRATMRISRDVPKTLVYEDAKAIANQVPTTPMVSGISINGSPFSFFMVMRRMFPWCNSSLILATRASPSTLNSSVRTFSVMA